MKTVDLRADYEVGTKPVSLTILIGDAQIGSSIVKLNSVEKGRGDIEGLSLGSGSTIKGKPLTTKSVVTDVNDMTNKTIVTYQLAGGKRDQEFTSSATVDEEGDSIIYRALFNLI